MPFADSPFWIGGLGILAVIGFGLLYVNDMNSRWLKFSIGSFLLFGGLFIAERMIETDREILIRTFKQLVDDAVSDRITKMLSAFEDGSDARSGVKREFENYKVVAGTGGVSGIVYEIDPQKADGSRTALISFRAAGKLRIRNGTKLQAPGVLKVKMSFRRNKEGSWKVYKLEYAKMAKNPVWRVL